MIDGLEGALGNSRAPGLSEFRSVLLEALDGSRVTGRLPGEYALKRCKVDRLRFELDGRARTLVVKRLNLARAQRNALVATRWLPVADLGLRGPALLGVAAERPCRTSCCPPRVMPSAWSRSFFRALGDPTRLRLPEFLLHAEHTCPRVTGHGAGRSGPRRRPAPAMNLHPVQQKGSLR